MNLIAGVSTLAVFGALFLFALLIVGGALALVYHTVDSVGLWIAGVASGILAIVLLGAAVTGNPAALWIALLILGARVVEHVARHGLTTVLEPYALVNASTDLAAVSAVVIALVGGLASPVVAVFAAVAILIATMRATGFAFGATAT
jgi:hypothetical protein